MTLSLVNIPAPVNLIGKVRRDLTGQVFGRLTVLARDYTRDYGKLRWVCKCVCGNVKAIPGHNLTEGTTMSCGCYRKEYCLKLSEETINRNQSNRFSDEKRAEGRAKSLKAFRITSIGNLSDKYVRDLLTSSTSLSPDDFPQSLVDAKRLHLQTKREINEKRQ